jgi:hypothetical protein
MEEEGGACQGGTEWGIRWFLWAGTTTRTGISGPGCRWGEGLVLFRQVVFHQDGLFEQIDLAGQVRLDFLHGFFVAGRTNAMGDPVFSLGSADLAITPGTFNDKHDLTAPSFRSAVG